MKKDLRSIDIGEDVSQHPYLLTRRNFFLFSTAGLIGLIFSRQFPAQEKVDERKPKETKPSDIRTNIDEIRILPRKLESLPRRYPEEVVKVATGEASAGGNLNPDRIKQPVEKGILELADEEDLKSAWLQFVMPSDIVVIKVNSIGGKLLSTKPQIMDCLIEGLLQGGSHKKISSSGTGASSSFMKPDSQSNTFLRRRF